MRSFLSTLLVHIEAVVFSEYLLVVIGANIYIVVVCPSEVRDRATGLYCTVVCPFKRSQRHGQTSGKPGYIWTERQEVRDERTSKLILTVTKA